MSWIERLNEEYNQGTGRFKRFVRINETPTEEPEPSADEPKLQDWQRVALDIKARNTIEHERLFNVCHGIASEFNFPRLMYKGGHSIPSGDANWRYFLAKASNATMKNEVLKALYRFSLEINNGLNEPL